MIGAETRATSMARLKAERGCTGRPSAMRIRKCKGVAAATAMAVRAAVEPTRPNWESQLSSRSSSRRRRLAMVCVERRLNTCGFSPCWTRLLRGPQLRRGCAGPANCPDLVRDLLRRKRRESGLLTKAPGPWHDLARVAVIARRHLSGD